MKSRVQLARLLANKRMVAQEKGVPFDLTIESLPPIPDFCPVLGVPLVVSDKGFGDEYSPSLDRAIPELGYVGGNVVWVSNLCNRLKNNGHWSDFEKIAQFYKTRFPDSPLPKRPQTHQDVVEYREVPKSQGEAFMWAAVEKGNEIAIERAKKEEILKACRKEMRAFLVENIESLKGKSFKYADIEAAIKLTPAWEIFRKLLSAESAKIFASVLREIVPNGFSRSNQSSYHVFIS